MTRTLLLLVALGCSKGEEPTVAAAPTIEPFAAEATVNGERILLPMDPPPTTLGPLTFSKHPTAMTLEEEGKMGGDPRNRQRTTYYFSVGNGNASESLELTTERRRLRAELVLFGTSVTVRTDNGPPFEVTLHSAIAPTPLTDEQCTEMVVAAATKRGLDVGAARSSRTVEGILEFNASSAWRGFCGTLTRRVWFTKS